MTSFRDAMPEGDALVEYEAFATPAAFVAWYAFEIFQDAAVEL